MLSRLLHRLKSHHAQGNPPQVDERKIISDMLCAQLGTCNVCQRGLPSQHRFVQAASAVVGLSETPSVTQLVDAAKARDWQLLTSFKNWEGNRDNLVTYAIACPEGGGMLIHIYDPDELYESQHLYRKEALTAEEMQSLSTFIAEGAWKSF
jgi:hypothetical protein